MRECLREQGAGRFAAITMAQDEASSVVWGMPGEAVKREAAIDVIKPKKIAEYFTKFFN